MWEYLRIYVWMFKYWHDYSHYCRSVDKVEGDLRGRERSSAEGHDHQEEISDAILTSEEKIRHSEEESAEEEFFDFVMTFRDGDYHIERIDHGISSSSFTFPEYVSLTS